MAEFLAQTLPRIPQFSHLSQGQLQKIEDVAVSETFPAHREILDRRGTAIHLVIVQFGHVQVLDQYKRLHRSLYRGDCFSIQSRSNGHVLYSASRVKLFLITHHDIEKVLTSKPGLFPAVQAFIPSNPIRLILLFILPTLLAIGVTFSLWKISLSFPQLPFTQWSFDPAMLPYTLGEIYQAHHDRVTTEAYFRASLLWNPHYAPAHNNLGVILYEQGLKDEAIAHWQQAVWNDPSFAQAYLNLGIALAEQGNQTEAISFMQKAIQLRPNDPEPYRLLGEMEIKQKNVLAARRAFLEASRLDDTDANTFYNLGYLYLVDKDYDRAIQHFEQALKLNPNLYLAEQGLGVSYFEQHQPKDALSHFEEAAALYPDDPTSYFYAGLIYEQQGLTTPSKDAFSHVVQIKGPADMIERAAGHIQRLSGLERGAEPMTQ